MEFHRVLQLPAQSGLEPGDVYYVAIPGDDTAVNEWKVDQGGIPRFLRGHTAEQQDSLERLRPELTKLEGLDTQSELDEKIENVGDIANENLNSAVSEINDRIDDLDLGVNGTVTTSMTLTQLNALADGIYEPQTSGTYANGLEAKEGYVTKFRKVGTVWTLASEVEVTVNADGSVVLGDLRPTSGDKIIKDVFNDGNTNLKALLVNKGKRYPMVNYFNEVQLSYVRFKKSLLEAIIYCNDSDLYNYSLVQLNKDHASSGERVDIAKKDKITNVTVATYTFRTVGSGSENLTDFNRLQLEKLLTGKTETIILIANDNSFKGEFTFDTGEFIAGPENMSMTASGWSSFVFEDSVYKLYEVENLTNDIINIESAVKDINEVLPTEPVNTGITLDIPLQLIKKSDGTYTASTSAGSSSKIVIDKSKRYVVSGQMEANDATLVAYYDTNDNFISNQFPSNGSLFLVDRQQLVVPSNAIKMAFSSYSNVFRLETLDITQGASLSQVSSIENTLEAVILDLDEINTKFPLQYFLEEDIILGTSIGRWIRKTNGVIETGGSAFVRDYEPIDKSKKYFYTGRISGTQGTGVAFRDIDDNFITQPADYIFNALGGNKELVREPILIPSNAESWAFSAWANFKIESGQEVPVASTVETDDLDARVTVLENETSGSDKLLKAIQWDMKIMNRKNELHGEYLRKLEENPSYQAPIYGVEWNEDVADPLVMTRIGDAILHQQLPLQSKMRDCVMKDGVVQYYLHPSSKYLKEDGVTPSNLDGTDGSVCTELPELFYSVKDVPTDGSKVKRLELCEEGVTGFLYSPKQYISSYQCTVDRELQQLASVCSVNYTKNTEEVFIENSNRYVESDNTGFSLGVQTVYEIDSYKANAARFRGNVNDSSLDTELDPVSQNYCRNNLGRPVAAINRRTARAFATNSKGFIQQYDNTKILYYLITVEYATRQLQQPVITAKDSNGFTQGGLGQGAVKYPDYAGYEKHFSPQGGTAVLPNGITNELGSTSGEVYFRIKNAPIRSEGSGVNAEILEWGDILMPVNNYRGIENIYGHLYNIIDNVDVRITNRPASIKDIVYYYQPNPYLTSDSAIKEGYSTIWSGSFISSIRVIKNLLWGRNGHILPIGEGGNSPASYLQFYTDCAELTGTWNGNVSGGIFYLTKEGRIVSDQLVGPLFWVGVVNVDSDRFRTSDTVRLQYFGI